MIPELASKLVTAATAGGNQFLQGGLILGLLGSIGYYLKSIPGRLKNLVLKHCTVVVDVRDSEPSYNWLIYWLEGLPYSKKSKRLSVRHVPIKQESKVILIPNRGLHWFFFKGVLVHLTRVVEGQESSSNGTAVVSAPNAVASFMPQHETITIRVFSRNRGIVLDILKEAEALFKIEDEDYVSVFKRAWGGWHCTRLKKRPLASVFLPKDGEDILDDIRNFISKDTWYFEMGIPHRRGYLFYGPPGTGKSSSAKAFASELNIPIYAINLAGTSDESFERGMDELPNQLPFILLIEDVDTVGIERDKTESDEKAMSLGTLLNALDGITSKDGVILIMTSNNPDVLDPALVRCGRVDKKVEFGYASESQIGAAIQRFIGVVNEEQCQEIDKWPRPITMADVQEKLKRMALGGISA